MGTIACIGTAGACGRIMGLNRAGIINPMCIVTSMATGNKAQFGTTTKTLQCELASGNAIAATELTRAVIEADPAALESKHGFPGLYGDPNPAGYVDVAETLGALVDRSIWSRTQAPCPLWVCTQVFGLHRGSQDKA